MAFESLTDKLQNVFKGLRSKGKLSEAEVKAALKEVKMALLEADVSFKVVKQFINSIQDQAVGAEVFGKLDAGQTVIKIVNEELVKLMGSETTEVDLKPGNEITVIMMTGLQGAGKTTTTAKLAAQLKAKRDASLCSWPATFTGPQPSSSCRSTAKRWAFPCSPWETSTSRWILPRRRWSMRQKTA